MDSPESQTISRKPLLRTPLILGRVSNLPTVWSNCLAGWLLAGGGAWSRFALLCGGASLLYIGGMFLNDACDVRFDTAHRQERPIPSGAISARAVWLWSAVLLLSGGVLLALLGLTTALLTLGLVLCIVAYDLFHKQSALAPLLMAGCRFLLYLVAGSAALNGLSSKLLWCAGALAVYIVALSFIARKEVKNVKPNLLVLPLFIAPLITGHLGLTPQTKIAVGLIGIAYFGWVIWSLLHMIKGGPPAIGRTVSALLAGIVLVDMLAVQGGGGMMPLAFLALFASALILQRTIPAT
jgi:4-hydroxybenzoate polyprenyltransferase